MSKDLSCKWNFVKRSEASMLQGREDSSFSHFFVNKYRCLVREYIQNSVDAHDNDLIGEPVIVVFSKGMINCSDYPELVGALPERLKACSEYCKSFDNGKDPYDEKLRYLNSHLTGTIGYLKVSDYNTKGMPYDYNRFKSSPFKACVKASSSSFKDSEHAGGSHGLGKTVGFVNSGINAVYYCTMTKEHKIYGEGVIKLCDHPFIDENNEMAVYENVAFYDGQKGVHPDTGNDIPELFRKERLQPGTDAFILGIELTDGDILIMKKEILRSFFKAIKDNILSVNLFGEEINAHNVGDKLIESFSDEGEFDGIRVRDVEVKFNPRPYFEEVLCKQGSDENHRIFDSDIDFPGDFPNMGHALLYMWKSELIRQANSRDSVVYMRDNNMTIEVKRGRNNKGYYAVFICDGDGSKSLRHMENVTHDKWDKEELRGESKESRRKAEKTLLEIKNFVLACEKIMFPEDENEERTINSLRNRRLSLLGNNNQNDDDDSIWPSTNLTERIRVSKPNGSSSMLETLKGKRKKRKTKGTKTPPETNPTSGVDPVPPSPAPPGPTPPTPPGPNPDPPTPITPPSGYPEYPDQPSIYEDGGDIEGYSSDTGDTGVRMREIKLDGRSRHLIPLHDGEFACKLILTVNKDYNNCRIELFVQGVSGRIPLSLRNVSSGCTIGGVDSNEILGFSLTSGNNTIKFTPVESVKNYTLIIKAYGN